MENKNELVLSSLGHTWILDLDGTIVKHNGYKDGGTDILLDGALDFLQDIPENDLIVFITSRSEEVKNLTERFLREKGIRFDHIIYNAPYGERVLVNDNKPSGLKMSYSIGSDRDEWCGLKFTIDEKL